MKSLEHENIVKLENMLVSKRKHSLIFINEANQTNSNRGSVYLVFEYLEHDMNGVLDTKIRFEKPQFKCIMK